MIPEHASLVVYYLVFVILFACLHFGIPVPSTFSQRSLYCLQFLSGQVLSLCIKGQGVVADEGVELENHTDDDKLCCGFGVSF